MAFPAVFGLAPAREDMFETIWELREASGTCGFVAGWVGGLGGVDGLIEGFADAGGGAEALYAAFGVGLESCI